MALFPEPSLAGASLALKRGPEPNAVPEIWLTGRDENGQDLRMSFLRVDGQSFALAPDGDDGPAPRNPALAVARLGQATRIAVQDQAGNEVARVSTRGSAAALLYMDEQQRRIGTVTALVRRGSRPAGAVPPPPALPRIDEVRSSGRIEPVRFTRARIDHLRKPGACDPELDSAPYQPEARRLGGQTMLVLIRCWQAAYNHSSLVLVGRTRDGSDLRPALFDLETSAGEATGPGVPLDGGAWDEESGRLASFCKGRGIGDCGAIHEWAWDGRRFRLIHAEAMGECRGSTDYITTWRAAVHPTRWSTILQISSPRT